MDSGFINQRDSDSMNEYNAYKREDYYKNELTILREEYYEKDRRLLEACALLKTVANGCYCEEDIKEFLK